LFLFFYYWNWRYYILGSFKNKTKNSLPYGGSITAALFLQNFVSKKKPFAHIDIAGPVWDDKLGATGFGAKLAAEWVRRQGQSDGESKE
jgi:leucyl aminopeptidase